MGEATFEGKCAYFTPRFSALVFCNLTVLFLINKILFQVVESDVDEELLFSIPLSYFEVNNNNNNYSNQFYNTDSQEM